MDDNESERMQILDLIDNGKISAEEGLDLLKVIAASDEPSQITGVSSPTMKATSLEIPEATGQSEEYVTAGSTSSEEIPTESQPVEIPLDAVSQGNTPTIPKKWHNWWMIPLWVGVGLTVAGALLMNQAQMDQGIGFWFVCASTPLILGVIIMALAWSSRTAPWLHVRVQQKPGERPQRIALSFPVPIRLTAWLLRTFGHKIPDLGKTSADEFIMALGEKTSPENPLYIQVDEGEDGEKVEVYIG
jgi:hypothetical protein